MRSLAAAVLLLLVNFGDGAEPTEIKGIVWSAVSPDGQSCAFEWLNDIWLSSTKGGDAKRLTHDAARDAYPKFSPDGSRLVFSSERSGSLEIYSLKLDGSDLQQHSSHTEGNILEAIAPDGSYAITRGLRHASGYKPFRLLKVDLKADSRELMLFDATAHSAAISPDGKKVLFCRSGEQPYRSGYRGSRACEIHLYDEARKSFQVLINEDWEARFPMWRGDGKGFYYLSNIDGCFNVWTGQIDGTESRQLTFFKNESVILPSISPDGKVMMFRVGYKTFRFEPESSKPPEEIRFFTNEELPNLIRTERVKGTSSVVFRESNHQMIFSAAGDIWMMDLNDKKIDRWTSSDTTDEREVALSVDGKTLYYLSDDGLKVDVMAVALDEKSMGKPKALASSGRSKRSLRVSPDGSHLSWLETTGDLVTLKLRDGKPQIVMKNWDAPTYDWSPDGKWLVVAAKDMHSNRDLYLVASDGSGEPMNLTMHPAFEGSPKWSPDGSRIAFTARREVDGLARIWKLEIGNLLADHPVSEVSIKKISDSIKRIETDISEPHRLVWSDDSKSLLFQSRDETDQRIYALDLYSGAAKEFASFRGIPAGMGNNGKSYWRSNRVPVVYDGEKTNTYDFSFAVTQARSDRLRLGFRKIWRKLAEQFYDPSMNGTDWDTMLEKYEAAATDAKDAKQFDRVVAQLLGELNASHLTFQFKPWGVTAASVEIKQPTSHPGLEFESTWEGPLVIKRVISGSPISSVKDAPVAGEIVRRINGHDVDARTSLAEFFNGTKGQVIPMVIGNKEGKTRTLELMPVSYGRIRFLDRKQTEAEARAAAEAEGLVYLPFLKMKSTDLERLSLEVYRASTHAKGIVLDLRNNAGGRVADELLALFCQPEHTFTIPRDGPRGYPTDRLVSPVWKGPMVVISNGNTFSNAEIFCHAYKQLGRGKLVGTPTNGGVISAVEVNIPEVGELQIPFRGWFHAKTGNDLELNGAVPDVLVPMMPKDEVDGLDPQLKAAIATLKEEVKAAPKPVEPHLKSERGK